MMDIVTKIFFVNLICMSSVIIMDKYLFEYSLIDNKIAGIIYGVWVLASLCSILIFIIYIVLRYLL